MPILIHGDAAFPGQGIVAETLNLSRLPGYDTGGTIHIIANNQLGFTADSRDSYSTSYASGLARGFKIPIVHVNADDPEACIEAARLAFAYRATFQRDFLIDLIGYRRLRPQRGRRAGVHAAADVPEDRGASDRARDLGADARRARRSCRAVRAEALTREYMDELQAALDTLQPEQDFVEPQPGAAAAGRRGEGRHGRAARAAARAERGAPARAGRLHRPPQARARAREARAGARAARRAHDRLGDRRGAGAGVDPRRRRQHPPDRRGRRARHVQPSPRRAPRRRRPAPSTCRCRRCRRRAPAFEIHNSPLSENAVVGFEYGYNVQEPSRLVIWEAQYGDFINGAQVIIDEFIVVGAREVGTAARRWCCCCRTRTKGQGPGSRERAARALPAARRRHQHARSPTARPPRSTSTCCGGRRRCC